MTEIASAPDWSAGAVAQDYSAFARQAFWSAYHWKAVVALHRCGLSEGGGEALDVGCGPGWLSIIARRMCPTLRVVGVDSSPEMVRVAAANAAAEGVEASFRVDDAQALGASDESFDLVTSLAILRLLDDPLGALSEAYRVVRPGGLVYFSDLLSSDSEELPEELSSVPHPAGREFLRRAFGSALSRERVEALLADSSFDAWECRVGGLGGFALSDRQVLEWVKQGLPLRELRRSLPRSAWAEQMSAHWIHIYLFKN